MWEEEFLSEDVGVTVLTDRNFVPRDEDWAEKRKREEDEDEEKKEEKKQKTILDFFRVKKVVRPRTWAERVAAAVESCRRRLAAATAEFRARIMAMDQELGLSGVPRN
ncbi:hypothetical protein FPOAC2_02251 [Fusarium poae]